MNEIEEARRERDELLAYVAECERESSWVLHPKATKTPLARALTNCRRSADLLDRLADRNATLISDLAAAHEERSQILTRLAQTEKALEGLLQEGDLRLEGIVLGGWANSYRLDEKIADARAALSAREETP